jgi:hypothetical protein
MNANKRQLRQAENGKYGVPITERGGIPLFLPLFASIGVHSRFSAFFNATKIGLLEGSGVSV